MRFKKVCVGGTFDLFHKGHEKLIERAFSIGEKVFIGIMGGSLKTVHKVEPYEKRHQRVVEFLKEKNLLSRASIGKIDNPYSNSMLPEFEAIVVSEETRPNAERINEMRKKRGAKPLKIEQIPWVRAEDGTIISSTAIRKGLVDRDGKLVREG